MKPKDKEHHAHLKHIENLLMQLGDALDKAQEKGWIDDNRYDVFKGFNDESMKEVQSQMFDL